MQENKDRRHNNGTKEINKSGVTCHYNVEIVVSKKSRRGGK